MGLFNFFNKKEEKQEIDLPIVKVTDNVNEVLLQISAQTNLALSMLDFKILSVRTFVKVGEDEEFIEITDVDKDILKKEEFLRDEKNEIKQTYEIEINTYQESEIELVGEIKNNKNLTYSEYILSPESLIFYKEGLEKLLLDELNKKKLKNSFLIGLLDEVMKEDIEKIVSKIKLFSSLDKKEKITLCNGVDSIETIQGKVIYHYEKNKRDLIYPVKKDEVIIEIIKPKLGKNGRNCKGEIIKIKSLKKFSYPEFKFSSNEIIKEEDDEKIVFIAKKNGYLYKENEFLSIKDELEVKQINLKTGNVRDAKDANVKLEVKEKNALKEAIADNMIVETAYLKVRGNVGNKAKINTKEVLIEGQTHKNSIINSDKAYINIHKGKLISKEAEIDRLEGGFIKGRKVKVNQAIGGRVVAEEVEVNILGSHVKITALKEIKIKRLIGEENILKIAPAEVLGSEEEINKIEKEIDEIKRNIRTKTKEYKKRVKLIKENTPSIKSLYDKYQQNKLKGIKTSATILKKLKEFKIYKKKTSSLKEEIETLKKELKGLKELLENLQNIIFIAKIVNYSEWKEFNKIEFDLIEPPIRLRYDTRGDEGICGFKLKDYGDEFKIVKIKVDNDSST